MDEIRLALQSIELPQPPSEAPSNVRGKLVSVVSRSAVAIPLPGRQPTQEPLVSGVVFRNKESQKNLRSSTSFLSGFCSGVRTARSSEDLSDAVRNLTSTLLNTGAYKGVEAALEPVPGMHPGVQNLVITLDETSYRLNLGASMSRSGDTRTGVEASLVNFFGHAESLSYRSGREVPLSWGLGGGGELAAFSTPSNANSSFSSSPIWDGEAMARIPTLWGTGASGVLQVRNHHDVLQEYNNGIRSRVLGAEASLTDASNTHSLSISTSWRQLSPARPQDFLVRDATLTSPDLLSFCTASVKNSVTVASSVGTALRPSTGLPSNGRILRSRVEIAGLGGDVSFAKLALNATWAASVGRYAPDTGYTLPKSAAEVREGLSDALHASPGLRPFPGRRGILPSWLGGEMSVGVRRGTGSRPQSDISVGGGGGGFNAWDRLASWLSPGASLVLDGMVGCVFPLSSGVSHPSDRFYAQNYGSCMKGFASMGPRGVQAAEGIPRVALGGDLCGAVTARLLLPPPLPSVGLVNHGVRSYLWGSLGSLAPGAERGGSFTSALETFFKRPSCSVGVGVGIPLAGLNLNLECTIAHPFVASDDVPGHKYSLRISG